MALILIILSTFIGNVLGNLIFYYIDRKESK